MVTGTKFAPRQDRWQRPLLPLIPAVILLLFILLSLYQPIQADTPAYTVRHTVHPAFKGVGGALSGDLDGDGDLDLAAASFEADTLLWLENLAGDGRTWAEHVITFTHTRAELYLLFDLDDDGDLDLVTGTNHLVQWRENEDGDATSWRPHTIDGSVDLPGSFKAADMDGDGDMDVLASSRNDDTITWYENTGLPAPGKFRRHLVTDQESRIMGIHPADVDGDSDLDLLTASTDNGKVGWWLNQRAPWQISGVDTAPATMSAGEEAAVLRLAVTHSGQAGDLAHELAALSFRLEDEAGQPMPATAVTGILADASLYLDDGSGEYEAEGDPWVGTAVLSNTVAGQLTFTFTPDDPLVYLSPGQTRHYFAVVSLSNDAAGQPWHSFRLTHLWQASQARYHGYDNSPLLQPGANVSSSMIQILTPDEWETKLYLPFLYKP